MGGLKTPRESTFIVDLAVSVDDGLADHFVDLLVREVLVEVGDDMTQLGGRDEPAAVLVEHTTSFADPDALKSRYQTHQQNKISVSRVCYRGSRLADLLKTVCSRGFGLGPGLGLSFGLAMPNVWARSGGLEARIWSPLRSTGPNFVRGQTPETKTLVSDSVSESSVSIAKLWSRHWTDL